MEANFVPATPFRYHSLPFPFHDLAMKFAKYLESESIPEWRRAYINYKGLKKKLKAVEKVATFISMDTKQIRFLTKAIFLSSFVKSTNDELLLNSSMLFKVLIQTATPIDLYTKQTQPLNGTGHGGQASGTTRVEAATLCSGNPPSLIP